MVAGMKRGVCLCCIACLLVAGLAGCATSPATNLSDLAALQQRADRAYAQRDWRDAAVAYQALANRVPSNAAYWFRLGNCYARLAEPQPAASAYRAALQRDPRIVPAWHNLGAVLLQQSQAAFQEAAANAKPDDPLKRDSALLAARIGAVRKGASSALPVSSQSSAAVQSGVVQKPVEPAAAASAPAASASKVGITPPGQGGGQ